MRNLFAMGTSNEANDETIGDRVRRLRKDRGWARKRLAEELGLDPSTVYRWEAKGATPRPAEVRRIGVVFGVTKAFLETGSSASASPPYWDSFAESYEHFDDFTDEEIEEAKAFFGRYLRPDSRSAWTRAFEEMRNAKSRPLKKRDR